MLLNFSFFFFWIRGSYVWHINSCSCIAFLPFAHELLCHCLFYVHISNENFAFVQNIFLVCIIVMDTSSKLLIFIINGWMVNTWNFTLKCYRCIENLVSIFFFIKPKWLKNEYTVENKVNKRKKLIVVTVDVWQPGSNGFFVDVPICPSAVGLSLQPEVTVIDVCSVNPFPCTVM